MLLLAIDDVGKVSPSLGNGQEGLILGVSWTDSVRKNKIELVDLVCSTKVLPLNDVADNLHSTDQYGGSNESPIPMSQRQGP